MNYRGLMFHHFHGGKHKKSQGSVSVNDFEKIIKKIGPRNIVSPREWTDEIIIKPPTAAVFCITFDDGLLSQYDVALPVLELYGLSAFWFVCSSLLEGEQDTLELYRHFRHTYYDDMQTFYDDFFLAANEIGLGLNVQIALTSLKAETYRRDLLFYNASDRRFRYFRDKLCTVSQYDRIMNILFKKRKYESRESFNMNSLTSNHITRLSNSGHEVGLHSASHPTNMEDLSFEQQFQEYSKNYRDLSGVVGRDIVSMSHPCGSYNHKTLKILRMLGITVGFRGDKTSSPSFSSLEIPRLSPFDLGFE